MKDLVDFIVELFLSSSEKRMLQQVHSFRPFFLVFGEAKCDKTLHFLRDLALLGQTKHKGCFFDFFLDVPLVLACEVELFEEQLVGNTAKRPYIYL